MAFMITGSHYLMMAGLHDDMTKACIQQSWLLGLNVDLLNPVMCLMPPPGTMKGDDPLFLSASLTWGSLTKTLFCNAVNQGCEASDIINTLSDCRILQLTIGLLVHNLILIQELLYLCFLSTLSSRLLALSQNLQRTRTERGTYSYTFSPFMVLNHQILYS